MKPVTTSNRKLQNGLTVADLIAELQALPEDAKVLFTCDYGDYHHTQQALPVTEVVEMDEVEYLTDSAYSRSGIALETLDPEDFDEEEADGPASPYENEDDRPLVVILR